MPDEGHHIQYVPEPPSVGMAFVRWAALSSLLLLVVSIGVLYAIYHGIAPGTTSRAVQTFPQPRVDTTESDELHRITAAQNKALETWQWADSQHTTVQVPIERAMELLLKKGADAYQPLSASPQAALSPPTAAAERTMIEQGAKLPATPGGANQPTPEPNK
jgi:hypothetical protein